MDTTKLKNKLGDKVMDLQESAENATETALATTSSDYLALNSNALDIIGDSNAKACKESVLIFLLRPNNIIPLLVRVPVTSKPRFLKYSTRL